MLRGDVAEKLDRKTRIVLDDAIDFADRLALRPELHRAQLQTFHENVARARRDAADIDPVDVDREKTDQGVFVCAGMTALLAVALFATAPRESGG